MTKPILTPPQLHEQGYRLYKAPVSIIAFDPAGRGNAFPALTWIDREEWQRGEVWDPDLSVQLLYRLHFAHRLPRDGEYVDFLAAIMRLDSLMGQRINRGLCTHSAIVIETNGVGWPAYSQLSTSKRVQSEVLGVTTTGTTSRKSADKSRLTMPRMAGLDLLRVMIETQRFKLRPDIPGAKEFETETKSFVWKNARPEALAGQNDDIVMSVAHGVWAGEHYIGRTVVYTPAQRTG